MSLRKLAVFVPLAVLVGAVVHVAAAGAEHAPGGRGAFPLLIGLAVALAISLSAAFMSGIAGAVGRSIATRGELAYGTLGLALAGTATYGLIEWCEGHIGGTGAFRALSASFPVAALVLAVSRRVGSAAVFAGSRAAAAIRASRFRPVAGIRLATIRRRALAGRRLGHETRRGRSPPIFA